MEKIYGYRENDIIGLAEFVKDRKNQSLSKTFESYAAISGKAKGTIRNLYYALVKLSNENAYFCAKHLDGKPLSVSKIVEFKECEEKRVIKEILSAKRDGRSVRSKVMELANGDGKLALRYQNKFRGAIKNKPEFIESIIKELKSEGKDMDLKGDKMIVNAVSDLQLKRLQTEINNLVSRISEKTLRENRALKERVAYLESENLKLSARLYGRTNIPDSLKYFRTSGGKNAVN
jgi:hypothetical protein